MAYINGKEDFMLQMIHTEGKPDTPTEAIVTLKRIERRLASKIVVIHNGNIYEGDIDQPDTTFNATVGDTITVNTGFKSDNISIVVNGD